MAAAFTGYDPRRENRAGLTANAIKFDIMYKRRALSNVSSP